MDKMKQKNTPAAKTKTAASSKAVTARKNNVHPVARRTAEEVTRVVIETKKDPGERKPFPLTTVFTCICFTALLLFMIMNYTALDKLKDRVVEQEGRISSLTDQRDKLSEKLAKKENLDEITKYAENELGMVKKDEIEDQYYIDLNSGDEVNITTYEEEDENGLGVLLTGAGNIIKEFFKG